jgi:hypothetical protein
MVQRNETFIARALRIFREKISRNSAVASQWRSDAVEWVAQKFEAAGRFWGLDLYSSNDADANRLFYIVNPLLYTAIFYCILVFALHVAPGVVAFVSAVCLGLLVAIGLLQIMLNVDLEDSLFTAMILVVFWPAMLMMLLFALLMRVIRIPANVLAWIITFVVMLAWVLAYALLQTVIVLVKLQALIPLAFLFVVTRAIELWRGIFYTCPSRRCAYRGLPTYVCPQCGTGHRDLWSNLYGLFEHRCTKCDAPLPTLDLLGRNKLRRLCGGCGIPLLGRHAGRAPERLVAIAGGPGSGKTNYLLMAVNEITRGCSGGAVHWRGEIDDPAQAQSFQQVWRNLALGSPAAKTAAVGEAFLLYATAAAAARSSSKNGAMGRAPALLSRNGSTCQLYLYDAPGEEFTSLTSMSERYYLPLLEGFIFLVDPLSFEAARSGAGEPPAESFKTVVQTTLGTTLKGARPNRDGKIPMRAAVVISKADLPGVRAQIGDVRQKQIPAPVCRAVLERWGAGGELRSLEFRFEAVEYFACSPLGRGYDPKDRRPFQAAGVLEPLGWVLTGKRQ